MTINRLPGIGELRQWAQALGFASLGVADLELDQALKFTQSLVTDPPRLVVDLAGIDVDVTLRELLAKVQADDPYILSLIHI